MRIRAVAVLTAMLACGGEETKPEPKTVYNFDNAEPAVRKGPEPLLGLTKEEEKRYETPPRPVRRPAPATPPPDAEAATEDDLPRSGQNTKIPTAVAGYPFGLKLGAVKALCTNAGGRYIPTSSEYGNCTKTPVSSPFGDVSEFTFCKQGDLCGVTIVQGYRPEHVHEASRLLTEKYGKASPVLPMSAKCRDFGRITIAFWFTSDDGSIALSVTCRHGVADSMVQTVDVGYWNSRHRAEDRAEDAKRKANY